MSPTCHSLDMDGSIHRSTCLLRSIPTNVSFLSVRYLFLHVSYFISFFRPLFFQFSTFLCCYSCTNIFISYTPTNIVPSVSRGQVIRVRFRTVEDQFCSQGSQFGASGRQRGTSLALSVLIPRQSRSCSLVICVYTDNGHISSHS